MGLRGRVTLAAVLSLGAALVIAGVGGNVLLSNRLDADASALLRDRAQAQLTTLDTRGGAIQAAEARGDQALDQQTWVFAGRRAIERPRASAEAQRTATRLAGAGRVAEGDVGDTLRLRAQPVRDGAGRQVGSVVVGASLQPYERTEEIARYSTAALALLVLLAGALVVRRAVGAALQPVAEMTERAADWSEHDLHRRFDLGPARDELTSLAATLDGLLGRIDAALRHEQRFSAEIAHQLRTPLSGVRARAELALREDQGEDDLREALERVLAGTDRMDTAITALLTSARGDARPPGSCDAHDPVSEALRAVADAAAERGVELMSQARAGAARLDADSALVVQALNPVLENAVRHARSRVEVGVEPGVRGVAIVVSDDGPGVAQTDIERIFEPGVSLDGGTGLGLALARRLVLSCGGSVAASPGPGGRFELRFPGPGG